MTTAATPLLDAKPSRVAGFDRLRGLAILLMVVDHLCAVSGFGSLLRVTVTRAAAPLFMSIAGAVPSKSSRSWRRWLGLAVLAGAETALCVMLGLGIPGIVAVMLVAEPVFRFGRRYMPALVLLFLGWWQATWLPLPPAFGYEPGFVVMWLAVGELSRSQLADLGKRLPAWLSRIGCRPRSWYLGHKIALLPVAFLVR